MNGKSPLAMTLTERGIAVSEGEHFSLVASKEEESCGFLNKEFGVRCVLCKGHQIAPHLFMEPPWSTNKNEPQAP